MAGKFEFRTTPIAGLIELHRRPNGDSRGKFERMFCATELADQGFPGPIRQINRSVTTSRGTIRGLHFQHAPQAEIKLVTCLRGRLIDVAVDIRRGSPTFLRWHAIVLDAEQNVSALLPTGIAHGFQSLTDDCELLYFTSADYDPVAEAGLNPLDPRLAIDWPEPVGEMSVRDNGQPFVTDDFKGIVL